MGVLSFSKYNKRKGKWSHFKKFLQINEENTTSPIVTEQKK